MRQASSFRTILAPAASACSFILAMVRASGFIPQSVLSVTRSAGTAAMTFRIRAATRLRRLDRIRPHVKNTDLDALVLGQVFQKLDSRHVAVRKIQNELVDALRFEVVRQNSLVSVRITAAQQIIAPRIAEAKMPADLRVHPVTTLFDHLAYPLIVVVIVREKRHPCAEVFKLEVLGACGNQFLHFRIEDWREREAEITRVLVVLEVGMPGKIGGACSDRYFHRPLGVLGCNPVKVGEPYGTARYRAAVNNTTPIVEDFLHLAGRGIHYGRVRFASRFKSSDALIHVPAERTDHADVIVVPHVSVGHDVQPGLFLIADRGADRIVVRLFVLHFFEGDLNVASP